MDEARWQTGLQWLKDHEEDPTNPGKANNGEWYDHDLYLAGCKRMEDIEAHLGLLRRFGED